MHRLGGRPAVVEPVQLDFVQLRVLANYLPTLFQLD